MCRGGQLGRCLLQRVRRGHHGDCNVGVRAVNKLRRAYRQLKNWYRVKQGRGYERSTSRHEDVVWTAAPYLQCRPVSLKSDFADPEPTQGVEPWQYRQLDPVTVAELLDFHLYDE